MRIIELGAWVLGIFFGVLAIVLGIRVAFALAGGGTLRRKAFVVAVTLATLWWPGFVERLHGQDVPPAEQAGQAEQKPALKDSPEWREMVKFWEETSLISDRAWSFKKTKEQEEINGKGRKLAEGLRPLEAAGALPEGTVDQIVSEIDSTLPIMKQGPMETCYRPAAPKVYTRAEQWTALTQQTSSVIKLYEKGELKPWVFVKVVVALKNSFDQISQYEKSGKNAQNDQTVVPEGVRRYLTERVAKLVTMAESGDMPGENSFKPLEPPAELKEEIATLVAKLGGASFEEREGAQAKLVEIGGPAIGQIKEALKSEDAEVRTRARAVLELFGE